jgi:hypothetical protein
MEQKIISISIGARVIQMILTRSADGTSSLTAVESSHVDNAERRRIIGFAPDGSILRRLSGTAATIGDDLQPTSTSGSKYETIKGTAGDVHGGSEYSNTGRK